LTANHSLEHVAAANFGGGDVGVIRVLQDHWLRVLQPGGIISIVLPDQAYVEVLDIDRDHKHAWSHVDFRHRVLDHTAEMADVVEYDTFNNHFSFNVVLRKKD